MKKTVYIALGLYFGGIINHIIYLFSTGIQIVDLGIILSIIVYLILVSGLILTIIFFLRKTSRKSAFWLLILSLVYMIFEIIGLFPLIPTFPVLNKLMLFSNMLLLFVKDGSIFRLASLIILVVVPSIFYKKDKRNET